MHSTNINVYRTGVSGTAFLTTEQLQLHIDGCISNNRVSQRIIYTSFYNYAMTICNYYSNNSEDAIEILNDGFLKIFKELYRFKPAYTDMLSSFKGWLRKIIIYTAIDHLRKNQKHRFVKELDDEMIQVSAGGEHALDKISYEEIKRSFNEVSPGYRMVLNLFIIEGFAHDEIAELLGISVGASKSNLARGRRQLQKLLLHQNHTKTSKRSAQLTSSRFSISPNVQKKVRGEYLSGT